MESGLALLLSSSNIRGPPGAMWQVSAGARHTGALPTTLSSNPTASQQRSRNQSSHKSYKSVICLLF